jgi:hypothetical protein
MKKASAAREAISSGRLYGLLMREFEKAGGGGCRTCQVPLPVFREPADEFTANWHIGQAKHCPFKCHLLLAEIQAKLWTRYDLALDEDSPPAK